MSNQKIERRSKSPNRGKSKTPTAALVRRTEPGSHGTKSSQNFVANAQSATPSITDIEKRPSGPVDPPNTKPVISKLSVIRDRKKTLTLNSNKVTEFPLDDLTKTTPRQVVPRAKPGEPSSPLRQTHHMIRQNSKSPTGLFKSHERPFQPKDYKSGKSPRASPVRSRSPMQSAKVSKREIQDPDIPDLSLSKLKSVSSFNRFDLNDDVSDKAIPRQKPNIKPEALPVFDEISDSKYGQKLSPNNVSSFIELLNYNSDSENDQPKDKLRVRKNIDGRAARQAENSGNDDPRETTQDFIQSTLVNMNSPPPTAPKKSPVSKVNLNVGAPVPPSPKNKSGLSPNSLVNRRAFEKLDEKLSKHPLCSFAGLPFVNPSKHSSKLVISEIPESVNMSKIKPLKESSIRADLRDDLAEREYSNPTTLDVERLRVLQDKSYNPSSRAVPVDSDMDPQSLKNIQMNEDLKKLQIKSKVLSRSSTPDILNDLLQEYMTDSGPPKPQTTKLTTKQSAPRFFLLDDPTVQQGELRRGSLNKAHQLSTEADNQTLQHKDYHNSHKGDQDHQEGSDFIFDEDSVDPNALL